MNALNVDAPDNREQLVERIPGTLVGLGGTIFQKEFRDRFPERHLWAITENQDLTDILDAAVVVRLRPSICCLTR